MKNALSEMVSSALGNEVQDGHLTASSMPNARLIKEDFPTPVFRKDDINIEKDSEAWMCHLANDQDATSSSEQILIGNSGIQISRIIRTHIG